MDHRPKINIRSWLKGFMFKRMHSMISCREFEDFLLQYLEEELTKQQRSRFEWHLRLCRECREYLEAYQRASELNRSVFETVPEDVPEDLIRAILDARQY